MVNKFWQKITRSGDDGSSVAGSSDATRTPSTLSDAGGYTPSVMSDETAFNEKSDGTDKPASDFNLVLRPKEIEQTNDISVQINPLPTKDGLVVSVIPPRAPRNKINHVPCDIVLVIDVSGSMAAEAPVPGEETKERNGLTVLDLVKHASRTIIETLDENDRLGVIAFESEIHNVQKLTAMTPSGKKEAWKRIDALKPMGMTNLWQGVVESISLFEGKSRSGCAPAILVLTDGMPNMMCPQQGYIPKLRTYGIPAPIHTFGFGYALRSGLLKSLAEYSGGNYCFIPDVGMIGTVFVHAVALLQSTFATSATLIVNVSEGLAMTELVGKYIAREKGQHGGDGAGQNQLTIPLDAIQYGQSRDIVLKFDKPPRKDDVPIVHAKLRCIPLDGSTGTVSSSRSLTTDTTMPVELLNYHTTRSEICRLLSALAPLSKVEEHTPMSIHYLPQVNTELNELISRAKARATSSSNIGTDPLNQSLLGDLDGASPAGQIKLALSTQDFYNRWGLHYLLSLHNAHFKQICNSFKDPGPLEYCSNSPLFIQCRDTLDKAFDGLPPPKPSATGQRRFNGPRGRFGSVTPAPGGAPGVFSTSSGVSSMSAYHRRDNPCFAGECLIRMADDGSRCPVASLLPGQYVWTPRGSRKVVAVVATPVKDIEICRLADGGDCLITPWHPVWCDGEEQGWRYPCETADVRWQRYDGLIFSLLLEEDANEGAHAVEVEGRLLVTLGHGVVDENDARAHAFLGRYERVVASLEGLGDMASGVLVSAGMSRDLETGLVCGFVAPGLQSSDPVYERIREGDVLATASPGLAREISVA